MTADTDALRLVPEMKAAGFDVGLFSTLGHPAGTWGFKSPFGESEKGFSKEADAWKAAAETFERERKIAAKYSAAPAVQPAAGREEIARLVACHLPAADCPDTVCLPITMTAGDLRKLYAAISTPAQASEIGGEPDEMTETAIRGRAKALLRQKGWRPNDKIHIHGMIELLTTFGMDLSRDPETERCAYPQCGCDFDATCDAALSAPQAAPGEPSLSITDCTAVNDPAWGLKMINRSHRAALTSEGNGQAAPGEGEGEA